MRRESDVFDVENDAYAAALSVASDTMREYSERLYNVSKSLLASRDLQIVKQELADMSATIFDLQKAMAVAQALIESDD